MTQFRVEFHSDQGNNYHNDRVAQDQLSHSMPGQIFLDSESKTLKTTRVWTNFELIKTIMGKTQDHKKQAKLVEILNLFKFAIFLSSQSLLNASSGGL